MSLRYLSVCSGIEAATAAWEPLGWEAAAFSEIDDFPRAVLAHHYPAVPCHGDFTTIGASQYGAIDLLVGGTPCQSFSIAGLRGGLDDDRGNLALEFLRLAHRARPRWLVWENVPGVLSSDGGWDFASILSGMGELGYGFAYRVLDAQYFGVPQRRRRVFAVGHLGSWQRAAAVLFERQGLLGDPAPRREARSAIASRPAGGLGTWCADMSHVAPTLQAGSNETGGIRPPGTTVDTIESLVPVEAAAYAGSGFAEYRLGIGTLCHTGGDLSGSDTLIAIQERAVSDNPDAGPGGKGFRDDGIAYTLEARSVPQAVAYDLRGRDGGSQMEGPHDAANLRSGSGGSSRSYVASSAVRRLTPRECERLQGFPDDYTLVEYRGKPAPDGPRYRAIGNSMAVPVMSWIGGRIAAVDALGLPSIFHQPTN